MRNEMELIFFSMHIAISIYPFESYIYKTWEIYPLVSLLLKFLNRVQSF